MFQGFFRHGRRMGSAKNHSLVRVLAFDRIGDLVCPASSMSDGCESNGIRFSEIGMQLVGVLVVNANHVLLENLHLVSGLFQLGSEEQRSQKGNLCEKEIYVYRRFRLDKCYFHEDLRYKVLVMYNTMMLLGSKQDLFGARGKIPVY